LSGNRILSGKFRHFEAIRLVEAVDGKSL